MTTARDEATATLLTNGTVLIAGGLQAVGTESAEIYSPGLGTFKATGSMSTPRASQTATLLPNGTVLMAGGDGDTTREMAWDTAEIYSPTSQLFAPVGNMTTGRAGHTATLLPDGTVLLAGGTNNSGTLLSSAEIYNPLTASFAATTASLNTARTTAAATLLMDGTVLIAGGQTAPSVPPLPGNSPINSAEIYSPSVGTFTTTGNMAEAQAFQTATLLNDGTVLEVAGSSSGSQNSTTSQLYSYPFTSGTMTPKFIVVGIIYSPPGAKSTVSYTQSTTVGTSSSFTDTFSTNEKVSTSLGISGGSKTLTGSVTGTVATTYSQSADSVGTYTVNQTTGSSTIATGPLSSAIGIDHDYDQVLVWLNPKANLTVGADRSSILWEGYTYDSTDIFSPNNPDVISLSIACLKNPFLSSNCTDAGSRTSRSWDTTSGLGGLTLADYAAIASSDPFFVNPLYNPNDDPNNRFTFTQQSVSYVPASVGDGANMDAGSFMTQTVSMAGQGASNSFSVEYSLTAGLKGALTDQIQTSTTTMWKDQYSASQTNTVGQTDAYSIAGPLATDNYSGPTSIEVFQDNVYGTFMFYAPGTAPTSPGSIVISPSSIIFSPNVTVGSASSPVPMTLTNNSTMPMFMGVSSVFPFTSTSTVLSPVAAFSNPNFSVVSGTDSCTGEIIAAGASCTLSVQFSPSSAEIGSGGTDQGGIYLTGETDAVVLATGALSGVASLPSGGGSIVVTGTELNTPSNPVVFDAGNITVTVNGVTTAPVSWGQGSTTASVATAIAQAINTAESGRVTAIAGSGANANTITLQSTQPLLNATAVIIDTDPSLFSTPSFSVTTMCSGASCGVVTTAPFAPCTTSRTICTIAGNGSSTITGNGGPALSAGFGAPSALKLDAAGNLFVADNGTIRKITPWGIITDVAGNGTTGFSGDGGSATSAELKEISGIAFDAAGNMYIADSGNNRIREVSASTGIITTIAGNGTAGFSGDNGPATQAELNTPQGVFLDAAGNIYIADVENDCVRMISASTGNITTIAGTPGTAGFTGNGGPATSATMNRPSSLAMDASGNLYIGELGNHVVRKVSGGVISTFAGNGTSGNSGNGGPATSAELNLILGLAVDSAGNVYIADNLSATVREVTTSNGNIIAVAGTGTIGFSGDGGSAVNAELDQPFGLAVDGNADVYIADLENHRVRITTGIAPRSCTTGSGTICTIAGSGSATLSGNAGPVLSAGIAAPAALKLDVAGNLYISDGNTIRKVTPWGIINGVVGNGTSGFSGDGGPATNAELHNPTAIAFDAAGNMYIADTLNQRIRKVSSSTGVITTIAGNGTAGFGGDNGPAAQAVLHNPEAIVLDAAGNIYFADEGNSCVRMISASTGIITTVAGTPGVAGLTGNGGPATSATLNEPGALALDAAGNLYIGDFGSHVVRKVSGGIITAFAGNGTSGNSGNGGPATSAELNLILGLAVDSAGDVYIADNESATVREVTASNGNIIAVAGTGTIGFSGDGGSAVNAELDQPFGLAVDGNNDVYIADLENHRVREVLPTN